MLEVFAIIAKRRRASDLGNQAIITHVKINLIRKKCFLPTSTGHSLLQL